jgi:hypothetical protein
LLQVNSSRLKKLNDLAEQMVAENHADADRIRQQQQARCKSKK